MHLTLDKISQYLEKTYSAKIEPESPYPAGILDSHPQPAAVLIPFIEMEAGWHLLFIRRTVMPHDRHSGQVAFPGGRSEKTDPNAIATALRETQEEVGINPEDIRILGQVREMLTITNYRITPIVGVIPWPYNFIPQEKEVDRIFTIPLNWLAQPANRKIQMRGLQFLGQDVPVIYFQEYDGEQLWGASARITLLLLEALNLAAPQSRYTQRE